MQTADGRPSGFDYMRLILALSLVGGHFAFTEYGFFFGYEFWDTWRRPISAIITPTFFALSGYLVAGSYFRSKTVFSYLGFRILRIFPAMAFETVLCAFILGPTFTVLSLREYFSDALFYKYFYNIIGMPHLFLPGVFASNPLPRVVNLQLCTIPWELGCYILVAVMSLVGIFRSRIYLTVIVLAINAWAFSHYSSFTFIPFAGAVVQGPVLVESFLAGVVMFVFSDRLPHDWRLFVLSAIATITLLFIREDYFASFPLAYTTVYLGLLNPRRSKIVLSGDYSYGIYLYAFPIQQAVACVNGSHKAWYLDVVYAYLLIVGMAVISWWLVEKSALSLRKYLPVIEPMEVRT